MYAIGIDFGGSSSKITVIDKYGNVVFTSKEGYTTFSGSDGKVTQNPRDWYKATVLNIKKFLDTGIDKEDIDIISFDGATHTTVLMDETNEPIMDSLYWTDTRSVKESQYLKKEFGDEIFQKCKHYPDTIWSLPELLYLKNNFPKEFNKTKHILFCKDYVRYQFVNRYVTDYIEAEGSLMFDFDKREWDDHLLSLTGLTRDVMPEILKPTDIVGTVNEKTAKEIGLSTKTKIMCGSTDTAFEVFASGGIEKGITTIKVATAGRICLMLDKYIADPNIINYSHIIEGLYYPGSATKCCGASMKWFKDNFDKENEQFHLSSMAAKIPVGAEGLMFFPYLNGELCPIGDANIRGGFINLSSCHTKGHFARAIMEGVSLSLLDCLYYLQSKGLTATGKIYILGGGGNNSIWRQITCDVLGVPLFSTQYNDSSFGNALLAGTVSGYFENIKEAFTKSNKIVEETFPNMENHAKYLKLYDKFVKAKEFLKDFSNEK